MADPGDGWVDEDFCYLTTTGRRTGKRHTIEIWFAVGGSGDEVYLLAGARRSSDWVRNIEAQPAVELRVRQETATTTARILQQDEDADVEARTLLVAKYGTDGDLDRWGATSLGVAVRNPWA